MQENERAMYTGIINCRNMEMTLHWTGSQFFLLILLAGLAFVARNPVHPFALFTFGLLCLYISLFWSVLTWRAFRWARYWESRLVALERSAPNPVAISESKYYCFSFFSLEGARSMLRDYIDYLKRDPWAWPPLVFISIFSTISIAALVLWIRGN